jgi:tetratricopeptide (TPR) repeat protein
MNKQIGRASKKKQARKNRKTSAKAKQNSKKGRLLEETVARMYQSPRFVVERNAKLPPLKGKRRRGRDIDLLLSSRVISKPARQAIECKNLGERIGIGKIDEFAGKLSHVGIPHEHGIFIAAGAYTKDAIDRACPDGIKLLTLTGLTDDRLGHVISEAFQFNVFYLAQVTGITVTNELDKIENGGELLLFFDNEDNLCGTVADLIWNRWQEGQPGLVAGEHGLTLSVPEGWHQKINGKREPVLGINATVQVWALTLQFSGEVTDHALVNAASGVIEKRRVNASFNIPRPDGTIYQLEAFDSEAKLNSAINSRGRVRVATRVPLPRIEWMGRFFYPLSARVAEILKQNSDDYDAGRVTALSEITVAEMEGTDLRSMWESLKDGYPGTRVPVVVTADPSKAEVVDVTGLLRGGEFKKVIEFEKHLGQNPRLDLAELIHEAYLIYGGTLLEAAEGKTRAQSLRFLNRAMQKVRRALRLKPNSADAYHNLGILFKEMGRDGEALDNFDSALALEGDRQPTLALRAKTLSALGRLNEAQASWEEVLSIDPENLEALYFSSGVLGALNRYEESVAGFDRVLSVSPSHAETWRYRGLGLLNLGRREEALFSFDKARSLGDENSELWSNRGRVLQNLGRCQEALDNYGKALTIDPGMFDVMINRGSMLTALGRHEEAIQNFDAGLAHAEGTSEVWNSRGASLQDSGRFDEALDSYEKSLTINPNNRMALMNRGLALMELDRLDEALTSFNQALELEPENIATLRARGVTLYEMGRNDEALADHERILDLDTSAFDVWSNKGLVLAELGRWEEAISAANEGLRLVPNQSEIATLRLVRAKILFLANRHADSAEEMVSAWKLDTDRVVSLHECRKRFIEAYRSLESPSPEQKLLFSEMSWSEAASAMASDDAAEAVLLASSAAQVYKSFELHFARDATDFKVLSDDQIKTISALADGVLERSTRRLEEFRDQEFAEWLLSCSVRQNAEAA